MCATTRLGALLWSCLFVFSLLAGNYLIRPVRDEMGIAGGTAHLPTLFAGTLAVMLVIGPLLSAPARPQAGPAEHRRRSSARLQLSLVAFFVAFRWMPPPGQAWAARVFFVWASVANLLVVSIAWGSLAGRFTQRPGASALRPHRSRRDSGGDRRLVARRPAGRCRRVPPRSCCWPSHFWSFARWPLDACFNRPMIASAPPALRMLVGVSAGSRVSVRSESLTCWAWDSGHCFSPRARRSSIWSRRGSSTPRSAIPPPGPRSSPGSTCWSTCWAWPCRSC